MKRIFPFLVLLLAASCARTVYVPVQHTSVRTDTLTRTLTRHDSIHVTDSVRVFIHGDTVEIERLRDRWHERTVTDTIRETKELRDTVPVTVEVEKPLTAWQHAKQDWGGWAIGACIMVLAGIILFTFKKK